ncbi:MAG: SpoVR family protein [Deltaproteobacteria bacterium]|nr:SpoVR family protein [Deltaproteobacteria bacterium]
MPLPAYLSDVQKEIEGYACEYGLDFFHTIFEILDYQRMHEVAAYGGYPTRYPHWRFGMEYEQLSKGHTYGLSKIYEMVINNDPCYAYLLEGNSIVDQKMVMAHVFAHCDFFKNNFYFSKTNRKMIDGMANHATRLRRHVERQGIERIEGFIDVCLSLDDLIDPSAPFVPKAKPRTELEQDRARESAAAQTREVPKPRAKSYMDKYINPPDFIARQQQRDKARQEEAQRRFPPKPERDVLRFLLEHAPLQRWERDVLETIRDESYYFLPQRQTKIMNEGWACVAPETLVFTGSGLMPMADLGAGDSSIVSDGERPRHVYDRHVVRDHATVRVTTARGFTLCGSDNHRVLLAEGTWRRLDALQAGDRLQVAGGAGLWPAREQDIQWPASLRGGLEQVARAAGVSVLAVLRHQAGEPVREAAAIEAAFAAEAAVAADEHTFGADEEEAALSPEPGALEAPRLPRTVDPVLGAFLGYLVSDGRVGRRGRVTFATREAEQALSFARLARDLFGVAAAVAQGRRHLRVEFRSGAVGELLTGPLGLQPGAATRGRSVPRAVLRSPAPVVAAFLRALFDCAADVAPGGVTLRTTGAALAEQVQLLLLNFGIGARRTARGQSWRLVVADASAATFATAIGFGMTRKQGALFRTLRQRGRVAPADEAADWTDEVVALEAGRGDVHDISVAETHRYAAAGLLNHNSYWHSTIMTERVCTAADIIEYADHASGVLFTAKGQLNPYKLGLELFRHLEDRWNKGQFGREWEECDDLAARRHWDRRLALGRKKIFEVRRLYNDVTFIDEFFTEEFCRENRFFSYFFNERSGNWEIESREFRKVKERLLFRLTNFGDPFIYVVDGNYENRGELLLKHHHEGADLKLDHARDTLANLERVWKRPVNLLTKVDGQGKLLRYDGKEHSEKSVDWGSAA